MGGWREIDLPTTPPLQLTRLTVRIIRIVGIAVVYALLARVGLLLDPVGGFATVVWAPTGVAIAAVLLGGWWMAAGVWIGAFVANLITGAPAATAFLIGVGNTLEALLAVALLRRVPWFNQRLERVNDALIFALVAAVAPVISASVGVAALRSADLVGAAEVWRAWRAWWLGDAIGALIVAPLILAWGLHGLRDLASRVAEAVALFAALAAVSLIVFFAQTPLQGTSFLQAYLVFPLLIWSTTRFTLRGAVTAILVTCVLAVAGTARGEGPFVEPRLHDSLFALQSFMGIVALSFLILAAALAEREQAMTLATRSLVAAAEANRAKSDFLASMSHELRTPLNAISGYAQMLEMDIPGALTGERREAVARIQANQRHLASLVDDMLSFTGAEAGRLVVRPTTFRAAESIQAVRPFVEPFAAQKGVTLRVAAVNDAVFVYADPDRLRQILVNLAMNAIKYTEPGGTVELSVVDAGDDAFFIVSDNGIGIPDQLLSRVFEPFFQVDHGHTRRYPGVGLGLTISRDLARAMGGEVRLVSEVAKGTIATVVLPKAPGSSV